MRWMSCLGLVGLMMGCATTSSTALEDPSGAAVPSAVSPIVSVPASYPANEVFFGCFGWAPAVQKAICLVKQHRSSSGKGEVSLVFPGPGDRLGETEKQVLLSWSDNDSERYGADPNGEEIQAGIATALSREAYIALPASRALAPGDSMQYGGGEVTHADLVWRNESEHSSVHGEVDTGEGEREMQSWHEYDGVLMIECPGAEDGVETQQVFSWESHLAESVEIISVPGTSDFIVRGRTHITTEGAHGGSVWVRYVSVAGCQ